MILTFQSTAQLVKSKDGVSLGKRSVFISSCIEAADKELININGVEIETDKYCMCVCDNLIPTINSWEMEKAAKENKMADLFLKDNNLEILMECIIDGNIKINEDYKFEYTNDPEIQNRLAVKNCVKEIMNDPENEGIWTQKLAEEYCECAMDKLFSNGYTYKDIQEIEDENSESFNEIVIPCAAEVLKDQNEFKSSNTYNIHDINGGGYRSLIPLIDYLGQGYKIKITISGVTKYYLFDTGASDLIIDRDTERELLLNGVLKRENYLGKTEYTLASNEIIQAQEIKVDNITIGDYVLNNVVIAVIDEGSLLCGKSFLDKFKKWELDKENNFLILYK
jgi:clan AA aspartic protease (TIGR02281 family)